MFGKRKKKQQELLRMKEQSQKDTHFFAKMLEEKNMSDATETEIRDTCQQMEADVQQMAENMREAVQMASENTQTETTLVERLAEYEKDSVQFLEERDGIWQEVSQIQQDMTALVEENKHFTSPSKFLSEYPTAAKAENEKTREILAGMQECGRQMSVLALNAAIEAGRLGEEGKQFVEAAQNIRTSAGNYNQLIEQAHQHLAEEDDRLAELEEQVHRLVTLLKENNISMTRMMKSCDETARRMETWCKKESPADFRDISNQVTVICNADEEISKSGERNRIQLENMLEELAKQKENHEELKTALDAVYQYAQTRETADEN